MNVQNVRNFIMILGLGLEMFLFCNFQVLKEVWMFDVVNNDDEFIYDFNSLVVFGRMLGQIGYKYIIVLYMNVQFWFNVKN